MPCQSGRANSIQLKAFSWSHRNTRSFSGFTLLNFCISSDTCSQSICLSILLPLTPMTLHCIFLLFLWPLLFSLLMFLVYCHGSQLYKCRSSPGFILSHGLLLSCVLYFRDFKFSHDSNHSTWAGFPQICVSGLNISSRCWHIFQIPKHLHQALLWHPTLDVFHPWLCFCLAPHLLVCNCSGLRLSLSSHPHTTCSPTCPFQSSCISPWISPSLMSGLTGCRNSTAGCL